MASIRPTRESRWLYLKRLDVHGFKSFANRTQLQFGPGVTCIVGPNGCGKTNVADSIRWVLGEHASRTLRARKTEDVIFAGSDKRAPMGMAEVAITLDNSEHWLPIDYDEVVVARRAYRSGENEYLINNTKVRLRDVVDLFMRAQVGQNSYAFMGQGMVEQVLSLRPEDRRALIEEAADVRLYRTKLEDAQHKLKATRENVDRVRMLVREIEPRIHQLERQATRAAKYQELTRELAATLHVFYEHQWREINDRLLSAITTHDQRGEDFERLKAEAKALEDGLAQLRAAIEERREEIRVREGRMRSLEDYARDLERRVALDAERERMTAERLAELTAEIKALRADLAAEAADDTPAVDVAAVEARLRAAREQMVADRARLDQVEAALRERQREAVEQEQSAGRARLAAEDLTRRIDEAVASVERLRRERDEAVEERRKAVNEVAAWAREYARLLRDRDAIGPQIDAAVREREREQAVLAAARQEQEQLEAQLRDERARVEALQAKLQVLEEIDVSPLPPDAGIHALLEAGGVFKKRELVQEDIELPGIQGVVRQLIHPHRGLERAVEAALAENLFAVVVDRETNMRAAMQFLLTNDYGRATMFALDAIQEVRPLHLIKERGIVGVASMLVKCDGRYRRLVDTLLGRTVVVEDLATAQRVVRRGIASAVATLDGVLVRPVGSVAAGSMSQVQAAFVREREVGEIPEELARLRPLLEERQTQLRDAAARETAAQRRIDELARSAEQLRERRARIESEMAQSRGRLGGFAARLQTLAADAERCGRRIDALTADLTRFRTEHAAADAAARDAALAQQRAHERAIALESERATLTSAITDAVALVAQLEADLRAERPDPGAERSARERLAAQARAKEEQRTRGEEDAHQIAARKAAAERELAQKTSEIAALAAELEPARQELQQLESRERSMTAQLAECNEKLRNTERALFDAESEVRARREELQTLRESLEAEGFVATPDGEVRPAVAVAAPAHEVERGDHGLAASGEADTTPVGEDGLPAWMLDDGGDAGLPPVRGGAAINPTEVRDRIADLRAQIRALGPINEEAASEYGESRERYDYLTSQLADLAQAETQLLEACDELEAVIRDRFRTTFKQVNAEFERYFAAFFRGGTARLELGETDEDGLPGIEIVAQPPGKKLGSLALLSGGERSLTAVALLFALLQANPSPICVLDEVDAALDEANVGRFVEELRALSTRTQFIIITHNRRTIENADTIYGVSMGADSVSKVLSLRLEDVPHTAE